MQNEQEGEGAELLLEPEPPTERPKPEIIQYILQRVRQNKDFRAVITGVTGSGKSYFALKMAEIIDPNFRIEQCVFSGPEFSRILVDGGLKPGSVIIFDEAGVAISSRRWQSAMNQTLGFQMMTVRHRNFIILFTSPDMNFLDSTARKLMHGHFSMQKWGVARMKLLQVNQYTGKTYIKYLRKIVPGYGLIRIEGIRVTIPSSEIRVQYEARKRAYTDLLYHQSNAKMAALEAKNGLL